MAETRARRAWLVAVPEPEGLDLQEARRALALLTDPVHRWELRSLRSGGSCGGTQIFPPPVSHSDMLGWAGGRSAQYTVYLNLNPVKPEHQGKTAKKEHMAGYHWLFLDIDPVKAESHKDDSATETEHEEARQAALEIHAYLGESDWPAPVVVDSGNGWYLLYRVELPATSHSQALLKRVGMHLAGKVTSRAVVDRSVHNVNRLAKLPGSWARKGTPTPERPHRMCRLVHVPDHLEVVPAELLARLVGPEDQIHHTDVPATFSLAGGCSSAYVRRALEGEVTRVALAGRTNPGLNNTLNQAAFALGTLGGAGVLPRSEAHAALVPLAISRGLGEREAEQTFESGWAAGLLKPRHLPENNGKGASPVFGGVPLRARLDDTERVTVAASQVQPRRVEWLWPWRIPLGKLTTFAGVGGLGKTFVLLDIAARVSRGLDWPDLEGECCTVGDTLFISGEDDPDDTLVPRLIELGADRSRIHFLTFTALDHFTLRDLPMLDRAAEEIGPALRLLVIDPPSSYLAGIDDHKNAELRQLLTPLKHWSTRHRVATVFNTHLNKPQGGKVEAMMRVTGSVAWVNAVRAAHLFVRDADNRERVFFAPMKQNLGPHRNALSYSIVAVPNDLARVVWLGEVDATADGALNNVPARPRHVVARDWLIERFRERREWPSAELFERARHEGVSRNAIFEARGSLNLPKARKVTHENGEVQWVWWVSEDWQPPATGKQQSP